MKKLDSLPSRSQRRIVSVLGALFLLAMPISATWDEGVASFRAHDYPAAAEAFARLVELNPESHQAHFMLGRSLLQQKQTAAARSSFEKAVAHSSGTTVYRLALASSEVALGRHDDALSTLSEIDPKKVEDPNQRSSLATLLGDAAPEATDPEAAEKVVVRALASDSSSLKLHLAQAHFEQKRGVRGADAEAEAYAKAYLAGPKNPQLGLDAARILLHACFDTPDAGKEKAYRRAVEVTRKLVREAPGGTSYFLAGQAAMGTRDYDAARRSFEKSLAADSPDLRAHFELGKIFLTAKEPQVAIEHLDKALVLESDPEILEDIQVKRGSALRHQERFVEAAAAYELAGETEKVKEMNELEAMRLQNVEYEKAKAECAEKERRVAELRSQNQDLAGTEAWRDLERQMAEIVAGCDQFHDEA